MSQKKASDDSFYKLKYMGYCMSQLPPEGISSTFEDFVNYAKFQLSLEKHKLLEDPIWKEYTDESILVEYFAMFFSKNKERAQEFETSLSGALTPVDDFNSWADKQIAKNQKELEEKASTLEDSVNFTPESLGG